MGLLKSDLRISAGLLKEAAPDNHLLAYITPNERDMLIKSGGKETSTSSGIKAYPGGGGTPGGYQGDWGDSNTSTDSTSGPEDDNQPDYSNQVNEFNMGDTTGTIYDTSQDFPDYESGSAANTLAGVNEVTKQKMIDETNRARRETDPAKFDNNPDNSPETIRRTKEIQAFENKYKKANMLEHYFYDKAPNNPKNELAYLNSLKASGAYIPPELQSILNAANKQGKDYKVKFTADQFKMVKNLRPTDGLSFSQYMLVGDPDRGVRPNPGLYMGGNVGNFYNQNEPSWWNESKHGTWETHKEDTISNMGLSTGQQDDENRWSRVADSYIVGGTTPQESQAAKWYANMGGGQGGFNLTTAYASAKAKQASILGNPSSIRQLAINQSPYYDFLKLNKLDRGIL